MANNQPRLLLAPVFMRQESGFILFRLSNEGLLPRNDYFV